MVSFSEMYSVVTSPVCLLIHRLSGVTMPETMASPRPQAASAPRCHSRW